MRSRGIPDLINGMDHGIVSRIKANGKISPEQVVVDGTRYPNDRKTKLPGKDIRSAECAVTPDHDECIHLCGFQIIRSEEHTSELQSLMRISYAVFCLKQKKTNQL